MVSVCFDMVSDALCQRCMRQKVRQEMHKKQSALNSAI